MKFLFKPIDPRQYAALRIVFGLLALGTFVGMIGDSTFYYSEEGWFPISLALKITERREWTLLHSITSPLGVKAFFCFAIAASLGMALGWRSRLMTWLTFVCIVSIQSRNWLNTYGGDAALRLVIFYLGFAATGNAWSFDSLRRDRAGGRRATPPEPAPIWPLRMIQVQICLLYFTTGLAKAHGIEWIRGTAMDLALMNPSFVRYDLSFLVNQPILHGMLRLCTWTVLYWEIAFPLLVCFRPTRWVALWIGLLTHGGIILFLQIHWFGYIMLASYLSFFDDAFFPRFARRTRVFLRRRIRFPHYLRAMARFQ
jgi:hypothetical protein